MKVIYQAIISGILLIVSGIGWTFAEQLPIRKYTIADGLARDYVSRIRQSSQGYLWFCTAEGLSRFDGYEFRNYTVDDGLPDRRVSDFLETRDGTYWIATGGGLVKFNPNGLSARDSLNLASLGQTAGSGALPPPPEPMFTTYKLSEDVSTNYASVLYEDQSGAVWVGGGAGFFRIETNNNQPVLRFVEIGRAPSNIDDNAALPIKDIAEAPDGSLWLATFAGLFRKFPNGTVEKFTQEANGLPNDQILSLNKSRNNEIWVGTLTGLCKLAADPRAGANIVDKIYSEKDGLPKKRIDAIFSDQAGLLWVGTKENAYHQTADLNPAGESFHSLGNDSLAFVSTFNQDRDGNLWIGTEHAAFKIASNGFITYKQSEGLEIPRSLGIFQNNAGDIFSVADRSKIKANLLYRFDVDHFTGALSNTIKPFSNGSWGINNNVFQDRFGEWWFATETGAYRFPPVENINQLETVTPLRVFTTKDNLSSSDVFHIYEDLRGDVWIGTFGNQPWLNRWERSTGKVYQYPIKETEKEFGGPVSFGEDAAGNLWFGYFNGSVTRYKNGEFRRFTSAADGVPAGQVRAVFTDSQKRLWIGTGGGGIARIDDPAAEHPHFKTFSTLEGLSSNTINDIAEDQYGRLYLAEARGVDRFEPETGNIKHYTTADGLAGNTANSVFRDQQNRLWFATEEGVSRLDPQPPRQAQTFESDPVILLSKLQIGDKNYPIAEMGVRNISSLQLAPDQNRLQIDFVSISFVPGEILQYQYRLGDDKEWSAPTTKRSISFANLAPGDYHFQVRALNSEGGISSNPAEISFYLPPPIWRRWWFIALAILVAGAWLFALDRYRVKKTRQVKFALDKSIESEERFRTLAQTASDTIITVNRQSRIIYVNEAVEQVFGYQPDELLGADLTVLMPEGFRDLHNQGMNRYLASNRKHIPWSAVELPGRHKDGREIPLELSFGEFTRNGEKYFTGIARDITERLRAQEDLRRAREERLRELEKVRKRIAADLHDDIGSSLTQISLLSEVVSQRLGTEEKPVTQPLSMIANASRELIDSMSDIVWAINPLKDYLGALTQRMRRFAADIFTLGEIRFEWHAAEMESDIPVGANVRREIFLIFKECINNIVKHADCTKVEVDLRLTETHLEMRLSDNGKGFDVSQTADSVSNSSGGHGLISMKNRVEELGGTLEIISGIGAGTITFLKIPLDHAEANSIEKN